MKKYILPLLIIALPIFTKGQTEIPKFSDKIIVSNNLTAEQNFIKVKRTLASDGIVIQSQDRDIFQIRTADIVTKWEGIQHFIVYCTDSTIQITGNEKANLNRKLGSLQGEEYSPIINRGMKGSILRMSFSLMNDFALKLGTDIKYESSQPMTADKPKRNKNKDDVYGF